MKRINAVIRSYISEARCAATYRVLAAGYAADLFAYFVR